MDAFFNGIVDWKKMADWITKNASLVAGPVVLSNFAKRKESDN